jgi:hypothetical protein
MVIECNKILDGDVHQHHLDTEEICILYDGLVVTQMAAGRRCRSTLLPSRDPVFEILVCYCALNVTFVLKILRSSKGG